MNAETEKILKVNKTSDKKAYFQKYYREHPEKYSNRPKKLAYCKCCKTVLQQKNLDKHLGSQRHQRLSQN